MEINDIITAISIKLNEVFGDDYENYVDEVPQGFQTPSFLILFLNLEQIQQVGKRRKVNTLFNIQYFTDSGSSDIANKSLQIQQALKEITLFNGSVMFSRGNNSEPVDGVLHNFMNFNFFLQEVEAQTFVESLEQRSTVKG